MVPNHRFQPTRKSGAAFGAFVGFQHAAFAVGWNRSLGIYGGNSGAHMMYIGKLAELTGATPKAIRFYESIGLMPAPCRSGKYRVYSDKDVALVKMIRRAQSVGFNLAELKELAALKASGNRFPIEIANRLITEKRAKLRKDMDEIVSLDRRLVELYDELNRNFG